MMIAAPSTHAHTAPGPARPAAFHAPNSQPDPMIEPRPVSIRANGPTSRWRGLDEDMKAPARAIEAPKEADSYRVSRIMSPAMGHDGAEARLRRVQPLQSKAFAGATSAGLCGSDFS